ncbi:hypothetical protein H9L39_02358 [Fusarium oxysporum f. sp. albedinis]|nr:hypothetical protein H9L39_02358 [Fusarium oxysporum f. sp. albedinis]
MCFLDKGEGMMTKSESISKVGVEKAMGQVVWDKSSFLDRGGIYDWGRSDMVKEGGCSGGGNKSCSGDSQSHGSLRLDGLRSQLRKG